MQSIVKTVLISALVLFSWIGMAGANEINIAKDTGDIFKTARLGSEGQLIEQYRLSKYDVINVLVVGFPNGIGVNDIMVGPDGYAQLPYAGTVKMSGLTIDEAAALLTERLGEYIKIPQLSIMIKDYGPRKVQVVGEVKAPGIFTLPVDAMNIFSAVSSAGGVATHGRPKHVQILRMQDDELYIKEVNLDAYVKKHDISQNIELKDGDIVYVPSSNKIDLKEDILPYISIYGMYKSLTNK